MIDGGATPRPPARALPGGPPDDAVARDAPRTAAPAAELAERLATRARRRGRGHGRGTRRSVRGRHATDPGRSDAVEPAAGPAPAGVPLVCLDTETTGLATATGTVAWLIGLGWWVGDRFRQVQLVLPDHADERALLTALAATIGPDAWLVTYNGRGFDWPLLVTRYRLARRAAPVHGGHLDLLPIVRRLFRHRMADARLQTAEIRVARPAPGRRRGGWEIPGRYLQFLRGGSGRGLVDVVRHNDQDVRSLARLLGYLETRLGDPDQRSAAASGDLCRAWPGRSPANGDSTKRWPAWTPSSTATPNRLARHHGRRPARPSARPIVATEEAPWWSPRRRRGFGGPRPDARGSAAPADGQPSTRRGPPSGSRSIGPTSCAVSVGTPTPADAWSALAAGPGRVAIIATIELAKLHEHRLGTGPWRWRRAPRPGPGRAAPPAWAARTGAGGRPQPADPAPPTSVTAPRPGAATRR